MRFHFFHKPFVIQRSMIVQFLISYILVFCIPIIGNMIAQPAIMGVIEDEINGSNILLMENTKVSVDKNIENLSQTGMQIKFMSEVEKLNDTPSGQINYADVRKIMQMMSSIKLTNNGIDDIYLFCQNDDLLISYAGTYQKEVYYDARYSRSEMNYSDWLYEMRQSDSDRMINRRVRQDELRVSENVEYITPAGLGAEENNNVVLVIRMNESLFGNIFDQVEDARGVQSYVVDSENQVMAASGGEVPLLNLGFEEMPKQTDNLKKRVNGKDYVFSYTTSNVENWKYVVVTPVSLYGQKVDYVRRINLIWILLSCLIGIYTIFYFSRHNYKGIKEISSIIFKRKGAGTKRWDSDEITVIKEYIQDSIEEQKHFEEVLEQHTNLVEDQYLSGMIKGDLPTGAYREPDCVKVLERIESERYLVLIYYIEDCGNIFFEISDELSDDKKLEYTQFIIENIVSELINERYKGMMTAADNMLTCVVGVSGQSEQMIYDGLDTIIKRANEVIAGEFNISTTAAVGGIVSGFEAVHLSFQQAMEAVRYRMLLGKGGIIAYRDIEGARDSYTFDLEAQQYLVNYIKTGNADEATQLIQNLMRENFSGELMSVQMAECLMIDIAATIMKAVSQIDANIDLLADDSNIMKDMINQDTIPEMQEYLMMKIEWICERLKEQRKDSYEGLAQRLKEFIQSNYADQNLNISVISESFHLSGAYLSKIFKTQSGEGLLDYLHKVRIEQGKKLLRDGENINNIAEKVGYINSNGFIRLFKKYEGITPGQYKKDMESER